MRDLLAKADLGRYAGQLVWLELNYDVPANRGFLERYGAHDTPSFFVLDSADGHVTAMQSGALSLAELTAFLDRGAAGASGRRQTAADQALLEGDGEMASRPAAAAAAYARALEAAPAGWPKRELAEASRVEALKSAGQDQACAEAAARAAAAMAPGAQFVRTVVAGMWCLASGNPDAAPGPWSNAARARLTPLAEQALALPLTVRDRRDALYRTLMITAVDRGQQREALAWGDRWLRELDAIRPRSDDERTALDIARVESIQVAGDPDRILPALRASEQALPHSYDASLRVAAMEFLAQRYAPALAACRRGLGRAPGAAGRAWLLRIEGEVLAAEGRRAEARQALAAGLAAARTIPGAASRAANLATLQKDLDGIQ